VGTRWCEFVEGTRFRGHEELDQQFVASGRYAVTAAGDVAAMGNALNWADPYIAPSRGQ